MAKIELNKNQTGLALGSLFALLHLAWVAAVGLGVAQALIDWCHSIHFLSETHVVLGLGLGTIVIGIITAFVSGYVLGWLFAAIWNLLGKKVK